MDFSSEIKRLQKLSCIVLSPEQEKKFGTQLEGIIDFLGKLPDSKLKIDLSSNEGNGKLKIAEAKLTLRTIAGVKENTESKKLMKNVKHSVVNNSIVIKSVLS